MARADDLAAVAKAVKEVEAEAARTRSVRRRTDLFGLLTVLLALRASLLARFTDEIIQ